MSDTILCLNAGSSSFKFRAYRPARGSDPEELLRGQVENLGPAARMQFQLTGGTRETSEIGVADHAIALSVVIGRVTEALGETTVRGVGHRIVHGGTDFTGPVDLTPPVLTRLAALSPLAPLHQPGNLAAVDAAIAAFPDALQIGCFDTAFHRGHPWVNDTFALPRRYYAKGVRRYGFHGLSYDYITGEIARDEPGLHRGRVAIAHLGAGASICAVRCGRSVASTMGFSALDGLPMGTRCGQLDPGVLLYMMDQEGLSPAQITQLLYRESGLKGLSGLSGDMKELEASTTAQAREAIDYFVFRIRREIGALAMVLGGLDALVFTGGIGENSALIRQKVTDGMGWIGVDVSQEKNAVNARDIGTGPVRVMVFPTDEERVIARALAERLQ